MNLPKGLPAVASAWNSLVTQNSYPSWGAKVQFDYILSNDLKNSNVISHIHDFTGVSDHRAISIEFDA